MNAWQVVALERLAEFEGGWSDDVDDRGGATKYGISLLFLKAHNIDINGDGKVDIRDVVDLTKERAQELMIEHFWFPWMDEFNTRLTLWVFDFGVNAGPVRAARALQRALQAYGLYPGTLDGVIGPKARDGLRAARASQSLQPLVELAFLRERCDHYVNLALTDPSQAKYLRGWIKRALT